MSAAHLPGLRSRWLSVAFLLGTCLFAPRGYGAEPPVTCLAFSPDGDRLLIGSQRGIVELDWPALSRGRELSCNVGNLHALAFSPNGKRLAVAGGDPAESGIVEIASWPELVVQQRVEEHSDSVMALGWMDDSTIVSASMDHQVVVFDLSSDSVTTRLSGHSKGVTALCLLNSEHRLVSAGIDQNLRVWDLGSGKLIRSLNNHTFPVHALALRPGDPPLAMVASASEDKTVRIWQPSIGRMVRFVRLDSVPLDVGWLADGSRIVVACDDGRVRMIDPDRVEVTQDFAAIDGWAYSLAVHPSDHSIVVGGNDGQLKRIELPDEGKPQR